MKAPPPLSVVTSPPTPPLSLSLAVPHVARSLSKMMLCLRADRQTLPEGVSKWAEEDNWMGGDVVVLTADTAEVTGSC